MIQAWDFVDAFVLWDDTSILSMPVDELDITRRIYNCLLVEGIKTVHDLIQKTEHELLRAPNFGRKSMKDLKSALDVHGLKLKGD